MSDPEEIDDLEGWKELCRRAADGAEREALLRTGWAGSDITPPPSLEVPAARVPLERAAELERRADASDTDEEAARRLREALAWLGHPHPRSSPALLRAIRRRREALRSRLDAS